MALQLIDRVKNGDASVEEVIFSLRNNDIAKLCEKQEVPELSTTEFIGELLSFLRQQCRTALESSPNTATSVPPVQDPTHSSAGPSNNDKQNRAKSNRILPAELTGPSPKGNFVVSNDDFPSLGDAVTPVKQQGRRPKNVPLQSTPVAARGNLEVANAPLVSEGIFNRSLPKSEKSGRKRASLTSFVTQAQQNCQTTQKTGSPKKRIAPIPVKRWQQTSEANFISAQVSHSPKEATKHQREVVRCINQETNVAQTENLDLPQISHVTSKDALDRLSLLYARCITCNLVPNVFLELSFTMQLLVIKIKTQCSRSDLLLGSASNCGYFSAQTLSHCRDLLGLLEPSSLTLLKNIPHVRDMCASLYATLCDLCSLERSFSLLRSSFLQGVSFDASVDSSENFPNPKLFGAFRRQRDAFYDLLKEWQKVTFSHHTREIGFNSRVTSIFDLSMDPCNMLHLAKLFVSQMVATCCGSLETDELGNTSESALRDLQNQSPEKFSKLRGRLEKPGASTRGSTKHQFTGQQAFFYNFILVANKAQFHEHLKNVLVTNLIEEDRFDISPEDADTSIDSQIREELYTLLYRLRLYGAFLGLLEFLPYTTSAETNPQVIESQRSAREKIPPRIDVERHLRESIDDKRLLPTLSWISTYFSMADTAVAGLPAYEGTLKLLNSAFLSCGSNRPFYILMRLLIGWIFQNLQISVSFNSPKVPVKTLPEIEAFVDVQLIHMLCPFLGNLKLILAEYYCLPSIEARKVVPMTAPDASFEPSGMVSKLEDAFFFAHSTSVKRTVNFVIERVPANVVKSMKPILVEQFREEVRKEIEDVKRSGEMLTAQLSDTLSFNLCARFQLKAENVIMPACDEQAGKLLDELLKADCTKEGILVARKICARQYHVRVLQWIRCHISKDYIQKELKDISKLAEEKSQIEEDGFEKRSLEGHQSSDSVNYIIDSLEELLRRALVDDIPSWPECLDKTERTMQNRKEWKPAPWAAVCHMLIDLGSVSIARYVNLEIVNAVIRILHEANYVGHRHVVDSPRNRYIIDKFCYKSRSEAKKLLSEYQEKLRVLENSVR